MKAHALPGVCPSCGRGRLRVHFVGVRFAGIGQRHEPGWFACTRRKACGWWRPVESGIPREVETFARAIHGAMLRGVEKDPTRTMAPWNNCDLAHLRDRLEEEFDEWQDEAPDPLVKLQPPRDKERREVLDVGALAFFIWVALGQPPRPTRPAIVSDPSAGGRLNGGVGVSRSSAPPR